MKHTPFQLGKSVISFSLVLYYLMHFRTSLKRLKVYFYFNKIEIIFWLILTIIILCPKPLTMPVDNLNELLLIRNFLFVSIHQSPLADLIKSPAIMEKSYQVPL